MGKINKEKVERVNAFKNELKSYNALSRDYNRYVDKLKVINNKMFGFGGPKLDGMPRNEPNPFAPNPLDHLAREKDYYDHQLSIVLGRLNNVIAVLNCISDKDIRSDIIAVYVSQKKSIGSVAMKNNYSERMMKYYINQAIWDALIKSGKQWMNNSMVDVPKNIENS